MGLIKKIFGGIFGFIGGIFGFIGKLFGLGKKSEYYLEIDDSGTATSTPAQSASSSQQVAQATADSTESTDQTQSKKSPATASNPSSGNKNSLSSPSQSPNAPLVLPRSPEELKKQESKSSQTFATDFLVTAQKPTIKRRRPGPSLSPFRDMAKQVKKTPSAG